MKSKLTFFQLVERGRDLRHERALLRAAMAALYPMMAHGNPRNITKREMAAYDAYSARLGVIRAERNLIAKRLIERMGEIMA